MNIYDFISVLAEKNVRLTLNEGKINVSAPAGTLTNADREILSSRKAEILAFLQENDISRVEEKYLVKPLLERSSLPLSFAQRRLWFIDQLEGGSQQYNMSASLQLIGLVNIDALQFTFNTIINRHESLRTVFVSEGEEPQQIIQPISNFNLPVIDLSDLTDIEQTKNIQRYTKEIANKHFELDHDLMLRAQLLKLSDNEHILSVAMHHIASDGWSVNILIKELSVLYQSYLEGREAPLQPLAIQYADYAHWQHEWLQGEILTKQIDYWQKQLSDLPVVHSLPLDYTRPSQQTFIGANIRTQLSQATFNRLQDLCDQQGITLFMGLHAVFSVLLARYSGETDIIMGSPIANREQVEVADLIGFFVNTLVLRSDLSGNPSFIDVLQQSKQTALDAYAHQQVPFEQLVEVLQPERSLNHSPLFQIMLVLQNNAQSTLELPGLTLNPMAPTDIQAKFDLSLTAEEMDKGLHLNWVYNIDLFNAGTIERMSAHFNHLLEQLLMKPTASIHSIELLNEIERDQQLIDWNDTKVEYPSNHCIHHLFEQQVKQTPDAIALTFEDQALTYAELNSRSNQLAHYLINQKHIKPDTLVGVCLERSLEMMVAILGILKAGGAYVPLDPDYPQARLTYMLEDAALATVLTCHDVLLRTPVTESQAVCLDDEWIQQQLLSQDASDLTVNALTPAHLAYIIYTSGSTGQPKGVMLAHQGLCNLVIAQINQFNVKQGSCILQFASIAFDAATFEWVMALCSGAQLALPLSQSPESLSETVSQHNVTHATLPPALLPFLKDKEWNKVKHIIVAGESCPQELAEKWSKGRYFYNAYGPSESTVCASIGKYQAGQAHLHMGKPIDNTQTYVLNENYQLSPISVVGELYIGGVGLARGYLNRDDLTQEKFIQNPFDDDPNARLYKTGDLARWLPDGNLEYIGRVDNQVKIRGFRIELGEIEHVLLSQDNIEEAVVIALEEGGDKRLVAYMVVDIKQGVSATAFVDICRQNLNQYLPEYMVPSIFMVLDSMPLTPNSKIDRKALPTPDINQLKNEYVAPTTETEKILCKIWQDILGVERVGIADNFFKLGGHSLLLIQLLARLEKVGRKTTVRHLFGAATLGELAALLDKQTDTNDVVFDVPLNVIPDNCDRLTSEMLPLIDLTQASIDQIVETVPGGAKNIQDIYPLAPLQEGILFHHQMSGASGDPYVMPMLLAVKTSQDRDKLLDILQLVVNRHDVLRTAILWKDLPQAVQVVCRHVDLPVDKMAIDSTEDVMSQLMAKMAPAKQSMDITQAPLLRIQTADDLSSSQYFILLQLHHIISDHVGLEIIQAEINAILQDQKESLITPAPYREFVAHALYQAETLDAETFFRDKLGTVTEPTAPFGLLDVHGDGSDIVEAKQTLPSMLSNKIRSLSKQLAVSPAALFHVGFGLVVGKCSSRSDVVFGTVLSGRLQGTANADRMLGMFINTLPFRLNLQDINVEAAVGQAQAELMALLPYEQTSLALAQQCSGLPSGIPLFSAMLNYRHSNVNDNDNVDKFDSGIEFLDGYERTNYPFIVSVDDFGEDFAVTAQVDSMIDSLCIVNYLQVAMTGLLEALDKYPQKSLLNINILSEAEYHQQLVEWNDTKSDYPYDQCIHTLFEQQVEKNPDEIAVVFEECELSYSELNIRANQLAHYLINEKHVKPDILVGVCLERSLEMIIAILGILKAGGAYVPLDPDYPETRLSHMLDDASLKIIITNLDLLSNIPVKHEHAVCLDDKNIQQQLLAQSFYNPDITGLTAKNLAYVIYTSGSTGKPKGVMVEQNSVIRLVRNTNFITYHEKMVIAQASNISFDAATFEIWGALLNGGKLVHISKSELLNTSIFSKKIKEYDIDTLFITTALFQIMAKESFKCFEKLDNVFFGGEESSIELVRKVGLKSKPKRLVHVYGPTENTTFSTWKELNFENIEIVKSLPIGKPLSNTTAYIVDDQLELQPIGVSGELLLGGEGLARGYLNRPDLTQEKFIQNPFSDDPNARLYKTGDLVRWLPDGNLEFMGRVDDQVKIRGFRIELGEIEHNLYKDPSIKDAVVIVWEEAGDKRLVAYVVAETDAIEHWREHLSQILPEYMVPSIFVVLDAMPLTPNGKIDRKALPVPDINQLQDDYVAPTTETEKILCEIWQDILGVERVSVTDNFFRLGGHSLLATRMIAQVNRRLNVELPLKTLFESSNLKTLSITIEQLNTKLAYPAIKTVSREFPLPLSYAQQRLWFIDQFEGGSQQYNMPAALRLSGVISITALASAFTQIIERHESLRTTFENKGEEPLQIIQSNFEFQFPVLDLSSMNDIEQMQTVQNITKEEANKVFDLSNDLMLRAQLLKLSADEHILLLTMHHIASDGWSVGILIRELSALYQAYVEGRENPLLPLNIQYTDYAYWQREWLQGNVLDRQIDYWKEKLSDLPVVHSLPLDNTRPLQQTFAGAIVSDQLNTISLNRLKTLCDEQDTTLFMGLHALFSIFLARYSGETDIVIGSPIANREQVEVAGLIGFFVNTLVLRSDLSGSPSFIDILQRSKQTALDAYAHQQVPFEQLVEVLQPERSLNHSPLFQILLVLQNNSQEMLEMPGLTVSAVAQESIQAKYDITLNVVEANDGLTLGWEYNTDLFNAVTIERMASHFITLAESLLSEPEENVYKYSILNEIECDRQLIDWNETAKEYPSDQCIHHLFEQQVERTPDAIALSFEDQQLTYSELNTKANQLAHYLVNEKQVKPDTLVGVCLERSLDMVIAILGILKAGGAYVPLDPDYPEARLAYMLDDASLETVLTHSDILNNTPVTKSQAVCLDNKTIQQTLSVQAEHDFDTTSFNLGSNHLAYVIYTSGSTGQPKGVMVEHRAIVNRIHWMHEEYSATDQDVFLQKTPFSFDVSVWEFFWPLMAGSKLVMAKPQGHTDPNYLCDVIQTQHVTKLHFVPSMLSAMLMTEELNHCESIRQVFCSGEALGVQQTHDYYQALPNSELHNLYGPTEAAVDVSYWDCANIENTDTSVPIGRPINNIQLHVLDEHHHLLPPGVVGELHIGGVGLARGYLNQPELTQAKFIQNPFTDDSNDRLYKTGDLVRWLPDGNLDYMGRVDHQVKIRGFRIELGEIEHTLLTHEDINEVVVVARDEGGDNRLVAYVVADNEAAEHWRTYITQTLPDYMVPSVFVVLDKLPLTPNGKVDRKALPAPDVNQLQDEYVAPTTETEKLLCEIWQDLLGVECVGITDNFFKLGGHSLLATRIVAQVNSRMNVELSLKTLFEFSTVKALATSIDQLAINVIYPPIKNISRDKPLLLSYAQQRLWFIDQLEGGSNQYNMSTALCLSGAINMPALSAAFTNIIERHESLRTVFSNTDDGPVQEVQLAEKFNLLLIDLSKFDSAIQTEKIQQYCLNEINKKFNLSHDLMLRAVLLKLSKDESVLLVTMHHIASDGWSIGVLVKEVGILYKSYLEGNDNLLLPLAIQYADYAHWQRQWLQGEVLDKQINYWREQLKNLPVVHSLPLDYRRPPQQTFVGAIVSNQLNINILNNLKAFCNKQNATLFMGLQAVFSVLLTRYSGETDIVVGSPIANREQVEVADLIGFFVNTLVLRSDLSGNPSFMDVLQQSKQTALDAYAHQQVPFEQLVEVLQPERSLNHSPLFQIMLVLQNNEQQVLEMPGLTISPVTQEQVQATFDLTLNIIETNKGLNFNWVYNIDLFNAGTIERMSAHFNHLLEQLLMKPTASIHSIELLNEIERDQQLIDWNDTRTEYPSDHCIHHLFEQQVKQTPDAIALTFEDQTLTYAELNSRSNQLAHYLLQQKHIEPDTLVGVCLERSLEMMVAILGILKAGGAYVPLDPDYPQARLTYMLEDAALATVLTCHDVLSRTPVTESQAVCLDDEWIQQQLLSQDASDLTVDTLTPAHLAYIIYTSGSTGQPKGVMLAHQGLCNLVIAQINQFNVKQGGCILQFASIAFDAAVSEWGMALCSGAQLALPLSQSPEALSDTVSQHNVTHATLPPALLPFLKDKEWNKVKHIIVAGESCPQELAEKWSKGRYFYNAYGPSESTVCASIGEYQMGEPFLHIGRPINNIQLYVLDHRLNLVPQGVIGELHIGGVGLARGYLKRDDLTQEKFIQNPFDDDPNIRLYKAGDLVRWLPDGNLEYIGRVDDQVKIRGFRIELGEIEHTLYKDPSIKEAVVVAWEEGGNKRLVAYVVTETEAIEDWRNNLRQILPEYMVPSIFVVLDAMPLTPNGKIDRKALPAPDINQLQNEYVAPTTETEKILCEIWQDVLGVERVGITDNFFRLGGHSLLLIQVLSRLQAVGRKTNVRSLFGTVTLGELATLLDKETGANDVVFSAPLNVIPDDCKQLTPEMLPLINLDQIDIDRIIESVPGGVQNIQDIYPLAPLQEGILFHHQMSEDDGDPYVMPMLLAVKTSKDRNDLLNALEIVINRHDVLRTAVLWEGLPQAVQVVCRHVDLVVDEIKINSEMDMMPQLMAKMTPAQQSMDITKASLLKIEVIDNPQSGQYFILLQLHHIISDHVGLEIIQAEVVEILQGKVKSLLEPTPYREFVAHALHQTKTFNAEEFFRDRLGTVTEPTAPFGLLDVHGDGSDIVEAKQTLPSTLSNKIRNLSKQLAVSPATLFHVAFGLVIGKCSGQDDVVFGTVLSGRLQGTTDANRMLGMFINTLPFRLNLKGMSIEAVVAHVKAELTVLLPYEQASLVLAQQCSGLPNGTPLFSAMLNYRHSNIDNNPEKFDFDIELSGGDERTNYPFTVSVDDLGDEFAVTAQVNSIIDPLHIIDYLQVAMAGLLDGLETHPQKLLWDIDVLSRTEHHQQLVEWNDTKSDYPYDQCIHTLFEQQVEKNPDAIAVVFEDCELSYSELNIRANQLAHYLINEKYVKPDILVGVCLERSLEMIIAILGILKAGGAYVPLDPGYPEARLAYILDDAALDTVITCHDVLEYTPVTHKQAICLDNDDIQKKLLKQSEKNIDIASLQLNLNHLAYIIYTSGSTGKPKGVMVSHQGLPNLIDDNIERFQITSDSCFLQNSSINFDAASWIIWMTLSSGARFVFTKEILIDKNTIENLVLEKKISHLMMTPSSLNILDPNELSNLKCVIVGGEACSQTLANRWSLDYSFFNAYGPTEGTICSTIRRVDSSGAINIGQPVQNTRVYVVSENSLVPVGVVGELYIGGLGLARGYLNRPELTVEKFIQNPFSNDQSDRLYKTGDLVRWLPDGNLEYMGRVDDQVKIRGFRIELGEIENTLLAHQDINEAVVIARQEKGNKRLVAYVVSEKDEINNWREYISQALPEYMMPSMLVVLDELPLTANGKIDRRILLKLDIHQLQHEYIAPDTIIEKTLCDIWQDILNVERVGLKDNFFQLGGHSLLATKMLVRINHQLEINLKIKDIFLGGNVKELSNVVEDHIIKKKERLLEEEITNEEEISW